MTRPGSQFPPLSDLGRDGARVFIDPALLDRPVDCRAEVEPPSWRVIVAAALGALVLIVLTWNGSLFG